MEELQDKEQSIRVVVDKLQQILGEDVFDIVDHWDADLCGIGLAQPENHKVLVYICTFGLPENRYFVSLELPSKDAKVPYEPSGDFENIDFDNLVTIVKKHLQKV